ncbi:MAG: hypothetical protein JST89_13370 [Cyanobacteria bacterium SZAS-4]|nr:hypothetical protein [Cyanobacteria bacterium SZAS-4]
MTKKKVKKKLVSMKETAVLQADNSIELQREITYDDGRKVCRKPILTRESAFYGRCKKRFALKKEGDWDTVSYTATDKGWIDSDSNMHWFFD